MRNQQCKIKNDVKIYINSFSEKLNEINDSFFYQISIKILLSIVKFFENFLISCCCENKTNFLFKLILSLKNKWVTKSEFKNLRNWKSCFFSVAKKNNHFIPLSKLSKGTKQKKSLLYHFRKKKNYLLWFEKFLLKNFQLYF